MTRAPFRAGLVGAGNICEFHVAAVQALPDVELVGICDLDAARAEEAAAKWDTKAFASLDALVDAGANVIHVLTPPSAHAKVAIAALERGCHVLIEKPIAESVEDARRIGEVAASRNLVRQCRPLAAVRPAGRPVARAGSIRRDRRRHRRRHLARLRIPALRGWPVAAASSRRRLSVARRGVHCLYLIQELLGGIEDVEAEWSSLGGDPNLAFDEWRALVRASAASGSSS